MGVASPTSGAAGGGDDLVGMVANVRKPAQLGLDAEDLGLDGLALEAAGNLFAQRP
jgi:hypothetical protein